jgi:16S rRNA (guanine527-N7)-methyltransferase
VPDADPAASFPPALRQILLEAREAGFLGPGDVEPHLRHAEGFLAVARSLSPATPGDRTRLLDLGSGAGLPGLAIASGWAEAELVLLDANHRRTEFLRRAVDRCGLEGRVSVVEGRAEVVGRDPLYRGSFAGVVARSFGPPAVVAECGAPFLRTGGWLVVSEPPETPESLEVPPGDSQPEQARRWPAQGLAQLGLEPEEFVRDEFGFQVLRQAEPCSERFPRRDGVPAKKPLF